MMSSLLLAIGLLASITQAHATVKLDDLFTQTPQLVDNDKAMLCYGRPEADCSRSAIQVVSETESNEGYITIGVHYRYRSESCEGTLIKRHFKGRGWVTIEFEYGIGCHIED
jgi:hypothetical protein